MTQTLEQKCKDLIVDLNLGRSDEIASIVPLTGGVASDIASVVVGKTQYCVKFALPKLKVAADWRAPVHRNAAEYAWLQVAADIVPQSAVQLFGRSEQAHGFAMEYVTGNQVYLWKARLLAGAAPKGEAAVVGDMIGRIHAASSARGFDRTPFQNRDDFRALRIEPYLTFTARSHPDVAGQLNALAGMLYGSSAVLVHGDVSPKNILFRDGGAIILDAECATMGDASFDPAFCLNHLVLKSVHIPERRSELLAEVGAFWSAYAAHVTWEPTDVLGGRIARLLPALMLGRVDGKSPVEYLDEAERAQVRALAISLIKEPSSTLSKVVERLTTGLKEA
ncbi:phosphotransferase family protein [Sulfitobacter geojensis]|uniref:Aminoglycoside phosphotransferase family protein n=2 Tax=Sulfitobacter geojensis TaxID=1342299 RepID=A0AAE2VYB7_9RHOB|nr:aminoglycoside phosphotransferase family protein [Sulfitobacter geojensis]MBM1689512.1 aminoglycoside phosphotransferase family protein [Sulfitobacter geojensis]MBM1693578.1 aminoglycoside phosphotransferase family protein [Sulfitobacter geojensis]MBM1705744.1 aminoglycoside phosphotransferase family protein [Sulfitobacter geojensis]MBM1709802.1 aminoglycoside phosphotransferase family protein [Sulfitobacter geojensis]MBM1713868.1 aminoglycoside phosphotransferase family protein [Sulfitobac